MTPSSRTFLATDKVGVRCAPDAAAVPLGDLPAGLYHCRILQDEQVLQTEKLSVIRR